MVEALADRDMGRVFRLVRQYAGASQTRLAIACGMTQGKISDITERKASLLIDTARAFLQCGKHGNAYLTLRAAQELAPEEISRRPAVRQVVQELVTTAPPSIRAQEREFADSLAASR
jgi:transcriptional regulator with XRE-family HTH domain